MGDESEGRYLRRKKFPYYTYKCESDYKPSREDRMRAPVIQLKKGNFEHKQNYASKYFDLNYQPSWDRRGTGRHYYSGFGEKRGFLSGPKYYDYEKEEEEGSALSGKKDEPAMGTPVILSRDKGTCLKEDDKVSTVKLLPSAKEKENSVKKENEPVVEIQNQSAKPYHIASKPATVEVLPERVMTRPVKLIDESLNIGVDMSPYLIDQSNFMVIAVIGMQGVGKSMVASIMADPNFDGGKLRFTTESSEQILNGYHCTYGVDAFVTQERVIILDCQPLLSPSIMDRNILQDKKSFSDFSSTENQMEVESLQLLTFAMSVSHVLLVVQDFTGDPNLLRLLQTCEMFKPPSSSSASSRIGEDVASAHQHFPHVVFVRNRTPPSLLTPEFMRKMQIIYSGALSGSFLEHGSAIGTCSGAFALPLSSVLFPNLNFFAIPDFKTQDHGLSSTLLLMRDEILGLRRNALTHVTLTEKSWYGYMCRMWDSIRKSNLYVEYSNLLP